MERIGRQVRLPFATAMQISLQGIRIRLGRALVTLSGVVLGIAFLMSVVTGEFINAAVKQERELRNHVKLMSAFVTSEVGALEGKTVSVAVFGTLSAAEKALLAQLAAGRATLRAHGYTGPGATPVAPEALGQGSTLLLILGDNPAPDVELTTLMTGMAQRVALDSLTRTYRGTIGGRLEHFFSAQSSEMQAKQQEAERQQGFRTKWIVIISLIVTVIGIANALLMSVTERFKEIGTMKCLGALSSFIRQLFLIESAVIGFVGSFVGLFVGLAFPLLAYGVTFGFPAVFGALDVGRLTLASLLCLVVGTALSILAAIYPANFAARMVPASALRSNV
jgi:flagellar basal body-associated protein FliL